jgi:hypothetical protein
MESSGLEVFTFSTPEGNVFYLVVDRLRERDNVHFLNAVTEHDLITLSQKSGSGGATVSGVPPVHGQNQEPPHGQDEPEPQPPANRSGSDNGTMIFIIIGAIAVGGIGYYVKILRPKKQAEMNNDGDDYDEGTGDEDGYPDYGGDEEDLYGSDDEE